MRIMQKRSALQSFACLCAVSGTLLLAPMARAAGVDRLPLEGSKFPIAAAVTVKAGTNLYFLSGAMGYSLGKGGKPTFGDTAAQTVLALENIKKTLARLGLGMGDVVKMTIFMAGDPAHGGKMDFAGMMSSYTKFFGTKAQPHVPSRSAVQVAALAAPDALVEIEVMAAK